MRRMVMLGFAALLVSTVGCTRTATRDYERQRTFQELPRTDHGLIDNMAHADIKDVVTKGNYSYIPLNATEHISEQRGVHMILDALAKFSKTHPELEVVSWHVDARQPGFTYITHTGLWVTHRPKK